MKNILHYLLSASLLFAFSCKNDDEDPEPDNNLPGPIQIEFDNVAIFAPTDVRQLQLAAPGDTDYDLMNELDQDFNITFLGYFISEIVLEGPNGEYFEDQIDVSATQSDGYYLIDEGDHSCNMILLEDVPAGNYNKLTFTVGVEEDGIVEGAAGGVLDPASNGMFWNWNAGYVAMKFEGQSPDSPGGTGGNTIEGDNEEGIAIHVGGWKEEAGTALVNNNRRITLTFDTDAIVNSDNEPHAHLFFNVLELFEGPNTIDFSTTNSVHSPATGAAFADNLENAFMYDHLHQ